MLKAGEVYSEAVREYARENPDEKLDCFLIKGAIL